MGAITDNTRLKGLATRIAIHTDVMDNPRYGARKLNRVRLLSVAIKNLLVHIVTVPFHVVAYHG